MLAIPRRIQTLTRRLYSAANHVVPTTTLQSRINETEALRILEQSRGYLEDEYDSLQVHKDHIPFYTTTVNNCYCQYFGAYNTHKTKVKYVPTINTQTKSFSIQPYYHTKTKSHECNGYSTPLNFPCESPSMQIYADLMYPAEIAEEVIKIKQFYASPDNYNLVVQKEVLHLSHAYNKIKTHIEKSILRGAVRDIEKLFSTDDAEVKRAVYYIPNFGLSLCYVPVYIYTYTGSNGKYFKVVNAYNGNISKQLSYSLKNVSWLSGIFGGTVGVCFAFVDVEVIPAMICLNMLFTACCAMSAYLNNRSSNKLCETVVRKLTSETAVFAEIIKEKSNIEVKQLKSYPVIYLKELDLSEKTKINERVLLNARNNKLAKLLSYNHTRTLNNAYSEKINTAYDELLKIYKQN